MATSERNGRPYYRMGMSDSEFRSAAHEMIEFVVNYYGSLKGRQASPSVEPGYMKSLLPSNAPSKGENWEDVFKDLDQIAMMGLTHWQSSRFFGYFSTASNYPSMLADILIDCCSSLGFTWASSPACTELELITLDWVGKAIGLPDCFLYEGKGPGCGIIQGSASESTVMTVLAARTKAIHRLSKQYPDRTYCKILGDLVAYASEYSHSTIEKACLIAMITLHKVPVDDEIAMRGSALKEAMEKDKAEGKIPFYVFATLGTTCCTSYDNIHEIAEVCSEEIWIHIDAAYAGSSFICPEFRHRMKGVEMVTSFNFNPHKWLMVNFDCSALWVKDSKDMENSIKVNSLPQCDEPRQRTIDYVHWEIPFERKFRSLKLWFVMRIIGIENLRKRIREDVKNAKLFEKLVREDERFEVIFPVTLPLVCFRLITHKSDLKQSNELNKKLLTRINESKDIMMIGSQVRGTFFMRLAAGSAACDEDAIKYAWGSIQKHASNLLAEYSD